MKKTILDRLSFIWVCLFQSSHNGNKSLPSYATKNNTVGFVLRFLFIISVSNDFPFPCCVRIDTRYVASFLFLSGFLLSSFLCCLNIIRNYTRFECCYVFLLSPVKWILLVRIILQKVTCNRLDRPTSTHILDRVIYKMTRLGAT